jgi:enamine deaminase RidA (YjgF/YER057c/UK114 family)
MNTRHNVGVSDHLGEYSDGVQVSGPARWLITSGTPGLDADGRLPDDFAVEAENAWSNILAILEDAGFTIDDLVKVSATLVRAEDIPTYRAIRERVLGEARPALMLSVVDQTVRPDFRIEIEVIAAAEGTAV